MASEAKSDLKLGNTLCLSCLFWPFFDDDDDDDEFCEIKMEILRATMLPASPKVKTRFRNFRIKDVPHVMYLFICHYSRARLQGQRFVQRKLTIQAG